MTEDELRQAGSRTIEAADKAEKGLKGGAGAVGALAGVETAMEAAEKAGEHKSTLDTLQAILTDNWPILVVIAIALVAYFYGPRITQAIRDYRTEDARIGANMKR